MEETRIRVLGIAGSLRRGSFNQALLAAARELAPSGLDLETYDRLAEIPLYNADVEAAGDPEPVADLKRRIGANDALLIATPEYNFGVPGVLKNAIDWASRPPSAGLLKDKPIALMGASAGNFGTVRAQDDWRKTFLFTRSHLLNDPQVLVARAQEKFDADGRLRDEATRKMVASLLVALLHWTLQLRASGKTD